LLFLEQAEEYGSHDKTFEISGAGTVRVTDLSSGKTIFEHSVDTGGLLVSLAEYDFVCCFNFVSAKRNICQTSGECVKQRLRKTVLFLFLFCFVNFCISRMRQFRIGFVWQCYERALPTPPPCFGSRLFCFCCCCFFFFVNQTKLHFRRRERMTRSSLQR
jgi:hypothetical protein